MNKAEPKPSLSIEELTAFLESQPDVFQRHPQLLELVTLADDRGAASLLERQIGVLKQRLQDQKSQQNRFMQVARENEEISDSFSELVSKLIGFSNLSQFATEFPEALRSGFNIDEVSFKTAQSAQRSETDIDAYENTIRRLQHNTSVCDNRLPSSIMSLFFSGEIKSAALIPMNSVNGDAPIGVIALGSKDADRYTHELGTAHLDRLGKMAGICFTRLQPQTNK